MAALTIIGVAIAGVAFVLILWGAITMVQIVKPERVNTHERFRWMQTEWEYRELPVGVREIQAAERRRREKMAAGGRGYEIGRPTTIPEEWHDELWVRRN